MVTNESLLTWKVLDDIPTAEVNIAVNVVYSGPIQTS